MISEIFFKDKQLLAEFSKHARVKHFTADEVLMYAGDKIVFVPIVMKGSIRVIRVNEDGREVFLYHIHPGQTCAMSLNCCRAAVSTRPSAFSRSRSVPRWLVAYPNGSCAPSA